LDKLIIERPGKKDSDAIYKVFEETIPDAFEKENLCHLTEDMLLEIESKKKLFDQVIKSSEGDTFFLVAKIEDEVIGTISFSPSSNDIIKLNLKQINNVGELGSLYVLPSYQGRGIASALIHVLLEHLHRKGIQQFCLDSGYRLAQRRWLRKFGTPYKIIEEYWGKDNHHMIWLCRVRDYIESSDVKAFHMYERVIKDSSINLTTNVDFNAIVVYVIKGKDLSNQDVLQ
jgi:GNAT superfamily N-acetyltransferase